MLPLWIQIGINFRFTTNQVYKLALVDGLKHCYQFGSKLVSILVLLSISFPTWYLLWTLGLEFEMLLSAWIQIGIILFLLSIGFPNWYLLLALGTGSEMLLPIWIQIDIILFLLPRIRFQIGIYCWR